MQSDPIIRLTDVSSVFIDERGHSERALNHVSFDVLRGEFLSIIGPSGCGKSTLLRLIAGVIPTHDGTIERKYTKLAMVFQNYGIFPWLTVAENVAFGLTMAGVSKDIRHTVVKMKLHEVGLQGHERSYPGELSGGQRQRVGVARALAVNPDVLLMDEPFSNLDAGTSESLKLDLLALWEKYRMTVVLVSHLAEDAAELSDRVIVMTPRPGTIKKIERVALTRPRPARGAAVHDFADRLVREATYTTS